MAIQLLEPVVPTRKKPKWKKIVLIIVCVLAAACLTLLIAIPNMIMGSVVNRRMMRDVYEPSSFGVEAESLILHTEDGLGLAAWLTETPQPKGTIIILSGIESPSVTAFFGYAKMFATYGYNSLLIEMRAHNASEGTEVGLGMWEWLDVKAGVDYLKTSPVLGDLPIIAMGTSMGAATVTIAAGEIPDIDGVIALSGYSSWPDAFADTMTYMGLPDFFASMEKPFVNLYLAVHYGIDYVKYTPNNGVVQLGDRPILLMHSTEDSQVPYHSYERLYKLAQEANVNVTTFVREGDQHFIVYDEYFETPLDDAEFSGALKGFLVSNFG